MSKDRKASLKGKFPQSEPTLLHKRKNPQRKVRLMDLCPEQKAKVGELMQLMQNQRQQNLNNVKLIKQYEESSILLKDKVEGLNKKVEQQNIVIAQLTEQLQNLQKEIQAKDKEMVQLTTLYEGYINREVQITEVQTISTKLTAIGVQTEDKRQKGDKKSRKSSQSKGRTKNIKIQTESEIVQTKKHSKSFQKVMRSHIVNSQPQDSSEVKKANHQVSDFKKQYQSNQQPLHTFQAANTSFQPQNEDDDVEIAQLTKAWASLKKHQAGIGIPKRKVNFEEVKKSRSSVPSHPSELEYSQAEASPTKLLEMYNQLRSASRVKKQPELDQQELNKMLKSGDFRARQALLSVRRTEESQSQHKASKMDFYETNLLDLVNAIAK